MNYCLDLFNYSRRHSDEVAIGNVPLGGKNPVRLQSMTNTSTLDTQGSVNQCIEIANAGGEYVRLTTQGVREAENLQNIKAALEGKNVFVPLVADVHFNPKVADVAALYVEKVRINPGNYVDSVKTFKKFEYTDAEYVLEINKIRAKFIPFIDICKKNKTAIRIGVNHGSLSDRIMSRYGDTPEGMVFSCMEFLRICVEQNFQNVVISIKASNTLVMVHTVRLLVATMDKENMHFPLHLGVTEAGDGEDGRVKSAVGIGSLLSDGIGDTIRVSLSENPQNEIPVARKIVDFIERRKHAEKIKYAFSTDFFHPYNFQKRESIAVQNIGGGQSPVVILDITKSFKQCCFDNNFPLPDFIYSGKKNVEPGLKNIPQILDSENWQEEENTYPMFSAQTFSVIPKNKASIIFLKLKYAEITDEIIHFLGKTPNVIVYLELEHINTLGEGRAVFSFFHTRKIKNSVILARKFTDSDIELLQIKASIDLGVFFLDGFGDGISIESRGNVQMSEIIALSFSILQATRARMSKTEYISCPSCGRTLFDIQAAIAKIKAETGHLKKLKIGIMGCIVNGPGEMADADYGYVGAGKGTISLYKKQTCMERNIPESDAVEKLIQLIKDNGDWQEKE